jgi:cystathionine beta-lyase/cystathionine gamma-synthase
MAAMQRHIDTQLIHAGEMRPRVHGAVSLPIFQSSTFEYGGQSSYADLKYIRMNNTPNHVVLQRKLAALEGAEAALVAASGMGAISTALLALLKPGDHLLAQQCLYGGTHELMLRDLAALGIEVDLIDGEAPDSWAAFLRPTTRLLYCETVTNPLMQVADLPAMAAFARCHGLVSLIDNTFASPVNFRPAEHGFDLSLHSGTKYLNGHSDIVAGAIIGSAALIGTIGHKLVHLGASLDPHACYLLHRGMKTLALRVRHQNSSALAIARFLVDHPAVACVNYPGLASDACHGRATALLDGFGGMLSFELHGDVERAERLLRHLTLPIVAPSLGGVETLITRPATTSHAGMPAAERRALGIHDRLIRLSVGIEAAEDLIADLKAALEA